MRADSDWVYSRALDDFISKERQRYAPTSTPAPQVRRRSRVPLNGRVLGSDAARAVGRFRIEGPLGYRAKSVPDAPLRATRAEAVADEAAYWDARDKEQSQ